MEEWAGTQDQTAKIWCFTTVGLEKTCERSMVSMEFKRVKHEGNNFWVFSEGLMLHMRSQYIALLRPRVKSLGGNWYWEKLGAGEGNNRGQDGCKASLTQMSWLWINLWDIWRAGEPRVLAIPGVTRVWQVWVTEQHHKIRTGRVWEMAQIACNVCHWKWNDKWDSGQLKEHSSCQFPCFPPSYCTSHNVFLKLPREGEHLRCHLVSWDGNLIPPVTWIYKLSLRQKQALSVKICQSCRSSHVLTGMVCDFKHEMRVKQTYIFSINLSNPGRSIFEYFP